MGRVGEEDGDGRESGLVGAETGGGHCKINQAVLVEVRNNKVVCPGTYAEAEALRRKKLTGIGRLTKKHHHVLPGRHREIQQSIAIEVGQYAAAAEARNTSEDLFGFELSGSFRLLRNRPMSSS